MPDEGAQSAGEADAEAHVFVYGTLRAGGSNDINLLKPEPKLLGMAQVQGQLFDLGEYPGLMLETGCSRPVGKVTGEVYQISSELSSVLDGIEEITGDDQDEYVRRFVHVQVQGRLLPCLVYEIHPRRVHACPLIEHGDWMAHLQIRNKLKLVE
jgi:gamma-glutamylcyclotransferase (GGCT)/AIG2-like uncharacterized protein YtfP